MKRKRSAHVRGRPPKRARDADALDQSASATPRAVEHPVLQRLYPNVLSLRHYLLSRLPASSKNRRRRVSQLGKTGHATADATRGVDIELGQLLDSTLVGLPLQPPAPKKDESRDGDLAVFSQQLPHSAGGTFKPGYFQQSEVGFHYHCSAAHPMPD